jgi:transcriptional regulator with XRE-family HTH domain
MDTFGDRLQAGRLAAGLTQERLAEMSGVSLGAIREYEQHKRDPLLSNAVKLVRALKQPLESFLPDADKPAASKRTATGKPAPQDDGEAEHPAEPARPRGRPKKTDTATDAQAGEVKPKKSKKRKS